MNTNHLLTQSIPKLEQVDNPNWKLLINGKKIIQRIDN